MRTPVSTHDAWCPDHWEAVEPPTVQLVPFMWGPVDAIIPGDGGSQGKDQGDRRSNKSKTSMNAIYLAYWLIRERIPAQECLDCRLTAKP